MADDYSLMQIKRTGPVPKVLFSSSLEIHFVSLFDQTLTLVTLWFIPVFPVHNYFDHFGALRDQASRRGWHLLWSRTNTFSLFVNIVEDAVALLP